MPYAPPPAAHVVVAPVSMASLDQQRWRRRVLLAIAPSDQDGRLLYQVSEFHRMVRDADRRDLILVTLAGGRVEGVSDEAQSLRARFHVAPGGYRTFLIGKDGHAALTSSSPIPAEEIVRTIDAMPMRRDEMKRR